MSKTDGSEASVRSQEWSGVDCLRILWQRKATLLGLACLGIAAAAALSIFQPRLYRSRAVLEVQGLNESFLELHNVYPAVAPSADAAGYTLTEAEVFQQDALLRAVAQKLRLETRPEYQHAPNIAERLREDIRIEPFRNSRLIQIVCDARNPVLAADLCNALSRACVEQAIEARQVAARETYDSLRPQLDGLRTAFRQSEGRGGAGVRAPEAEMYQHFYTSMLRKAGDAWMASRVRQANIRVVGPAEPPSHPYKPNLPLNLALGSLLGVLGAGFVLLQAQNHPVLREPGEASLHLAVPELGAIPRVKRSNSTWKDQRSTRLPESFRATSASILSATRRGGHGRTMVVTSAWPTEGKTTVVRNLGIALAEISDKVLLIDGDMRRPELHKAFDEANSWGLTDILRETNAIDELPVEALVKKTSVPHVYLLPSGVCPDNVLALLCAERMSRLLPRFQEEFDFVLVDAPPYLEFADARVIAQHAGELLLVVRANHTHRSAAQAAVERMRLDGIPMMGVILNRWDQKHSTAYGYPAARAINRGSAS